MQSFHNRLRTIVCLCKEKPFFKTYASHSHNNPNHSSSSNFYKASTKKEINHTFYKRDGKKFYNNLLPSKLVIGCLGISIGFGVGIYLYNKAQNVSAAKSDGSGAEKLDGLPYYSLKEVSKHKTIKDRVWMTYNKGVYDVTDFIDGHPGGDLIWDCAGGALDQTFTKYKIHKSPEVLELLESFRIGNFSQE